MAEWTDYAVEIRVPIDSQGTVRVGTGYVLPHGRILTALHVVVGDNWPSYDLAKCPVTVHIPPPWRRSRRATIQAAAMAGIGGEGRLARAAAMSVQA